MPVNAEVTTKQWNRYAWCRDGGHMDFVEKAERCERFFRGDQWSEVDRARLALVQRPALTINKIMSTVGNVIGEQIKARAETSFRPRSGSSSQIADILTKVYKQISDNNHLTWKRSDLFSDGVIRSRGFLDIRIDYNDAMEGEVRIEKLNSKNVIIDPDADQYDPDTWSEVFVTKWVTADDIAVLYTKADAELLRNRASFFEYSYDSIEALRDRAGGGKNAIGYVGDYDNSDVQRSIRVIERQYRKLDRLEHFVSPESGDMRAIPEDFSRDKIAYFVDTFGFKVVKKAVRRIRWTTTADNVLLHDEWSPYQHFTPVPYFPYFRDGHTIGLVENLIGPQELLNKVSSQELHVVNTTANSGYKVRAGSLVNMTVEELEAKGAQTGIVIEVNGDPDKDVQKISPNQVPQGLDRISYKAEEHIKSISGVSDSMQGFDREDVAAKAIQAKRQAGSTNLVEPLDQLTRTDAIIARNILDLVQEFYTEERLMTIVADEKTGETENFSINQVDQSDPYGKIINDLTVGEYDVVVTSVPARELLEDSQFDQAVALKELGINLPDSVLIDSSRLMNKHKIIKEMQGDKTSAEAQAQAALQQRAQEAEVAKLEGEAGSKAADAGLKAAKTKETEVKIQVLANTPVEGPTGDAGPSDLDIATADHKASIDERTLEQKRQVEFAKLAQERRAHDDEMELQTKQAQVDERTARVQAMQAAAAAAVRSTPTRKAVQ